MTEGRPKDWSEVQKGQYSIGSGQQTPAGPYAPLMQHPHYTSSQPCQPYVSPQGGAYPPPLALQHYGTSYAEPYAPPYSVPVAPLGSPLQQPYSPGFGYQQPLAYGYMPFMKRPEAPSANTAMVLGIISLAAGLLLCPPVGLLGIAAVITGNRAKREIRESRNYLNGQTKVTTALTTGWIAIVVGALWALLILLLVTVSNFNSTP